MPPKTSSKSLKDNSQGLAQFKTQKKTQKRLLKQAQKKIVVLAQQIDLMSDQGQKNFAADKERKIGQKSQNIQVQQQMSQEQQPQSQDKDFINDQPQQCQQGLQMTEQEKLQIFAQYCQCIKQFNEQFQTYNFQHVVLLLQLSNSQFNPYVRLMSLNPNISLIVAKKNLVSHFSKIVEVQKIQSKLIALSKQIGQYGIPTRHKLPYQNIVVRMAGYVPSIIRLLYDQTNAAVVEKFSEKLKQRPSNLFYPLSQVLYTKYEALVLEQVRKKEKEERKQRQRQHQLQKLKIMQSAQQQQPILNQPVQPQRKICESVARIMNAPQILNSSPSSAHKKLFWIQKLNGWTSNRMLTFFNKNFQPCVQCFKNFVKQNKQVQTPFSQFDPAQHAFQPSTKKNKQGMLIIFSGTPVCQQCSQVINYFFKQQWTQNKFLESLNRVLKNRNAQIPTPEVVQKRKKYLKRICQMTLPKALARNQNITLFRHDHNQYGLFTWKIMINRALANGFVSAPLHLFAQACIINGQVQTQLLETNPLTIGETGIPYQFFMPIKEYQKGMNITSTDINSMFDDILSGIPKYLITAERIVLKQGLDPQAVVASSSIGEEQY